MFKKFYLCAILSLFLLSAQNAWVMPFGSAYDKLTSLMKERYDIRVKAQLRLNHIKDRDIQANAENYFDAFYGVRYFLISGKQKDSISIKKHVNQLGRISNVLFAHNWAIHQALMNDLLSLSLITGHRDKEIDGKHTKIAAVKALIRSGMHQQHTLDLDRVVPSRTPRKKLHSRSSRAERVEYLAAPSPTQPLF